MTRDLSIIFSGPMVRALLDGRKTMTRRILKPQPIPFAIAGKECDVTLHEAEDEPRPRVTLGRVITKQQIRFARGDRLWVRENIWQAVSYPGTLPSGEPNESGRWSSRMVHYAADGDPPNTPNRHYPQGFRSGRGHFAAPDPYGVWLQRPSIHMPRWASRVTLLVTGVKLERLQAISLQDVRAEGCEVRQFWLFGADGPERQKIGAGVFGKLWSEINGRESWDANHFVVAISFRTIKANIDTPEARIAA